MTSPFILSLQVISDNPIFSGATAVIPLTDFCPKLLKASILATKNVVMNFGQVDNIMTTNKAELIYDCAKLSLSNGELKYFINESGLSYNFLPEENTVIVNTKLTKVYQIWDKLYGLFEGDKCLYLSSSISELMSKSY